MSEPQPPDEPTLDPTIPVIPTETPSAPPPPPLPPPSYTPPPPFTPPPPPSVPPAYVPPPLPSSGTTIELWGLLEIATPLLLLLGLFLDEDDAKFWDGAQAWAVFAIVCAVVQLAPLLRNVLKWTEERAWTVGAVGAAGVVTYWVLLVLPAISRNTSFAITLAAAAAVGGSVMAPGRRL